MTTMPYKREIKNLKREILNLVLPIRYGQEAFRSRETPLVLQALLEFKNTRLGVPQTPLRGGGGVIHVCHLQLLPEPLLCVQHSLQHCGYSGQPGSGLLTFRGFSVRTRGNKPVNKCI